MNNPSFDVFICHASEDKEAVARPLVQQLKAIGLRVWYDEDEILAGESVRAAVDKGLSCSRFVVLIVSEKFFEPRWAPNEYSGASATGKELIPVRHGITPEELAARSPLLGDKKSISTDLGLDAVAREITRRVRGREVLTSSGVTLPWLGDIAGTQSFLTQDQDAASIGSLALRGIFSESQPSPRVPAADSLRRVQVNEIPITSFYWAARADWELSEVGADGVLTRAKLKEYLDQLKEDRQDAARSGSQWELTAIDDKIDGASGLLDWIERHRIGEIEYLPANLQSAPGYLKRRAVEVLINRDHRQHPREEIDQAVLDYTRRRYSDLRSVGYTPTGEALEEIDELAGFLGLR